MIKGLSQRRRLPRAGVIRLGIKVKKGQKEYPKETDYFVCPEIVQEVYGKEPKELVIMFPVESEQVFFQQFYKKYGNGILLCRGDGEIATCFNFEQGDFEKKDCPCEDLELGRCKPIGILQFILPEVKEAVGVWQVSTSSKNSIIDLNSGIDYIRGLTGDRISMIPLLLKREETKTQKMEKDKTEGTKIIKGRHYTMKLSLSMSLVELQRSALIPPSRALLPSPDETQESVDDLFPVNGFEPKEEKEDINAETEKIEKMEKELKPEEVDELTECKKELSGILVQIKDAGRELTDSEAVKLDALQTAQDYQNKIKYWTRELDNLKNVKGAFNKEK